MSEDYKLQLKGIEKSFPGVRALKGVSLNVRKGTVHAIVGENGAGKSTLMNVLFGSIHPEAGEIWVDGKKAEIHKPLDAERLGISMIFQELSYMPELTIKENLVINRHPTIGKTGIVDWKKIDEMCAEQLKKEHIAHSPNTKLRDMSISDIQMLEIVKATTRNAKIIIMDEPTSSLTQHETNRLFDKIERLRQEGVTILYISHKMEEIFKLSDDVTIMRDGEFVSTKPISEVNAEEVISMMVGRKVDTVYPTRDVEIGDVALEVKNLSYGKKYKDISFNTRKGEIVGFAGLVGAGRTEIMRGIFGLDPVDGGEVLVDGMPVKHYPVAAACKAGIMMTTEDRRKSGMIGVRSIKENISLASLERFCKGPFIQLKKEEKAAKVYYDHLRIKAPDMDTLCFTLSGGNQQKVVLAKWMLANPKVFILDEPTRGIDVGAKYEIYNIMNNLAKNNTSIVVISSELPELLGMCDRIYVVCEGRIAGEVLRKDFSSETIMKYATGGK